MKTRTKKRGLFAALAVTLLIIAALIASCVDPVDFSGLTSKEAEQAPFTPPPEKGYISVSLPEDARTILPSAPGAVYYKVDISNNGSGNSFDNDDRTTAGTVTFTGSETFNVDYGSYTVTVGAWTTPGFDTGTLVAVGQSGTVTVNTTTPNPTATVTLEKDVAGTYTGTFSYAISCTPAADTTFIAVTKYSDNSSVYNSSTASGSTSLASGYYWVTATVTKAKYGTRIFSQIAHIYAGHTSTWTVSGATLVQNAYDVTYNLNYGGAAAPFVDTNSGNGWPYGGTITNYYTTNPSRTGYTFDGWFKENTNTNLWTFAGGSADKIYADTTLYAGWTEIPSGTVIITINPYSFSASDESFVFSPLNVSLTVAQITGGATISVTATTTPFTGGLGWYYGSSSVVTGDTLTDTDITTFGIDLESPNTYDFTFKGDVGVTPYSGTFTIEITP